MTLRHLLLTGIVLIVACTVTPERPDKMSAAALDTQPASAIDVLPANQSILFWTPAETQVGFRSIDKVMPQLVRTEWSRTRSGSRTVQAMSVAGVV